MQRISGEWKRIVLGCVIVLACVSLAGCAVHPRGPHGPRCDEIEATATIRQPTERMKVLRRIAAFEDLTQHEQIYMVNAILSWGFGDDKADAFMILIDNPCCTAETQSYILEKLKYYDLGRAEARVIHRLLDDEEQAEDVRK